MNSQATAVNDKDDPFKELNPRLSELRQKKPSYVREDMTAEILMVTDDNVLLQLRHLPMKIF